MAAGRTRSMTTTPQTHVAHPLAPLSADELSRAVDILRRERGLGPRVRFATVTLHEPPKSALLDYSPGESLDRQVFAVLLDNEDGQTYEAIVSLTEGRTV